MRAMLLATGMVVVLSGCAASGPPTAWGKTGVSRIDYGTDIGTCTGRAAVVYAGNGANTAGGISGANTAAGAALPDPNRHEVDKSSNTVPPSAAATSNSLPASGTYSGTASADYAQRAAMQQRAQEMAVRKAQADTMRQCLTERGYKEFVLTAEQRAKLSSLKTGSNEYHEYLYSLSTRAGTGGTN